MTPNTIEFKTTSSWVMRITADRRIEVNEDVDVTEAAKKVLEAMQLMLDKQKRTWVRLTVEEKNEITWGKTIYEILELFEAKLKEKNFD
jgi:predicted RNA binding protein with dsRBD fold (UPF0201 family)